MWMQIHDVAASAGIVLPEALRPCGLPLSATYTINFSGDSLNKRSSHGHKLATTAPDMTSCPPALFMGCHCCFVRLQCLGQPSTAGPSGRCSPSARSRGWMRSLAWLPRW